MTELTSHMGDVARRLLGDPNKSLSSRRELRYGAHGSLSIDLETGTWFDHENQAGGGVVALIRRELKGANGTPAEWLKSELGIDLAGGQPVAEYPYKDERGNLLFEVVRFEPKTFRQRRPDGRGGWQWSLGKVRRVPFHLPELLEAGERTIHIVEGEKDVLTLERHGLVATCNPGGAEKWRKEFAQFFRAADVVILPDNDEAGERHAQQVANNLQPVASRVRIQRLPDLPPKGDVTDWFRAGGSVEQLAELCGQSDSAASAGPCLSVADWLKRDIPAPDRLLGHWLSTTSRGLLVAPTGLGKTNVTMAIGFAMAAGRDFLHWQTVRPARVMFVDGEMSRRLVKARLSDAVRRLGEVPATFFMLCRDDLPDMPPLNTPEGQAFIDRTIEQLGGVDFIMFDNVQSLISGDMKDEESWQAVLPWAKSLTKRSIGQLWIHHTGHDQTRSYGTSTREWQLDTVVLLELVERPGADIAFSLKFTKARERAPHNRADFEPVTITLATDQWAVETSNAGTAGKPIKKPSPKAIAFHKALVGALVAAGKGRPETVNQPSVTMEEWHQECARRALIDPNAKPNQQRALISKYRLELIAHQWMACSGNYAWNRTVAL